MSPGNTTPFAGSGGFGGGKSNLPFIDQINKGNNFVPFGASDMSVKEGRDYTVDPTTGEHITRGGARLPGDPIFNNNTQPPLTGAAPFNAGNMNFADMNTVAPPSANLGPAFAQGLVPGGPAAQGSILRLKR